MPFESDSRAAERKQPAIATLRAAEWMPITAVRVLTGIFFCISGGTKLLAPDRFSTMERTLVSGFVVEAPDFSRGSSPALRGCERLGN